MRVEAVVPAWMLADGEFVGLGPGDPVPTGLALAVTATRPGRTGTVEQDPDRPGLTTLGGRTAEVGRSTLLDGDGWTVALFTADRVGPDLDLVVQGWLTAEPYLWHPEGELARARPEGRPTWTVDRVRVVGGSARDLDRLPAATDVDPDLAYVLDLSR